LILTKTAHYLLFFERNERTMKKLVVFITLLMALVTFINAYSRESLEDSSLQNDTKNLEHSEIGRS